MQKLIRNRYALLGVAGRGGQGEVLRAADRMHDRVVALKVRVVEPDADRQAILSEARILLNMRPHPLVSLVREDFFENDRYYVVMDWVDGVTLHSILAERGGTVPLDEALEYLSDVAGALAHLHGHSPPIVHRDVKPANVIVNAEGRAVLVDFGIATGAGAVVRNNAGTGGYTAPEVLGGGEATPASDVFSLAATAFALLTGAPPRAGKRPRWQGIDKDRAKLVELALTRGLSFDPSRRHASAPDLIAAMRSSSPAPGNLPLQLTTFVGRERMIDDVSSLLQHNRLVTLTGPGGIGKTRLALAAAERSLGLRPDGVWLAQLAAVMDPDRVPQTLASAMGVREPAGASVAEALTTHMESRDALVVIDNCEHVLAAAARLVRSLLESCPAVRVLTTSRESLGISGEAILRVPPLDIPSEAAPVASMGLSESVALFVERARLVRPGFVLHDDNASTVAKLVARLDGIPLAIELAAARVRSLAPAEILLRLDDRFKFLSAKKGERRSLRAVVDWSYDLLDDSERGILQAFSVFVGGFTLEAAERVADGDVVEALESLVDKSLVTFDDSVEPPRYGMLETIRAYAGERLSESGRRDEVWARHRDVFGDLVAKAELALEGADQAHWLDVLEAEHGNVRQALELSIHDPASAERAMSMAAALWRFWDMRGYLSEGRWWFERVLALSAEPEGEVRARALRGAAGLALDQGDYVAARALHEESISLARACGARATEAAALNGLAIGAGAQSDFDTERRLYVEALDIWRELGNERGIAVTLGNLGTASYEQGNLEDARRYLDESLSIRRKLGDRQGLAQALNGLALVAGALGDSPAERALFEESLELWREIGYRRGVAIALLNLGTSALTHGDRQRAAELLDESASMLRELGVKWDLAECLQVLGDLAYADSDLDTAASRYIESLRLRKSLGDKRGTAEALEALATVASARERHVEALVVLTAANGIRTEVGAGASPGRVAAADSVVDAARRALDKAAFDEAAARELSVDDASAVAEASARS